MGRRSPPLTTTTRCHPPQRTIAGPQSGVQLAVQRLADGTYASISEAVDALKVSKSTLHRHLKGGLTRQQAHEKDQLLTHQEEKALANWITGAMAMGTVKGGVRMMEIRWMNSDVNRPSEIDEGRRRR